VLEALEELEVLLRLALVVPEIGLLSAGLEVGELLRLGLPVKGSPSRW
jgi:hypothetical protein